MNLYTGKIYRNRKGWKIAVINIEGNYELSYLESSSYLFKNPLIAKRVLKFEVDKMNRAFQVELPKKEDEWLKLQ